MHELDEYGELKMYVFKRTYLTLVLGATAAMLVLAASGGAQEKRMYINATAMGTSTQMGRLFNIRIIINDVSSDEERTALIKAFQEDGSRGLSDAVSKMKSKGRITLPATVGYDINYIRIVNMPDGSRRLRFITDRPITVAEHRTAARLMDYALTMGEIVIKEKKGKSKGFLAPAAKLKVKKNELEIETYQNPWKLTNIDISD